jgi:glycosyltransferase involved in cell wall biosynthesis
VAALAVCGDGSERGALEALMRERGLESCVKFHGFVPWGRQLEQIYDASDVFVLPSLSEGVPKVLLEAMSRGVPIIATEVGGVGDILRNLENGILVAPGAAGPIAEAVRRLEHDDRLRARLVRGGLDFARDHTAARQAKKLARWIQQYATAGAP